MKNPSTIKAISLLFIIGMVLTACSGSVTVKTDAAPTQSIELKMTQSVQVQPTTPPQPTKAPTPALPAMVEYKHPSNSFSISVPSDWVKMEETGLVLFSSPDETALVSILAENTVNALDADAFTKAINNFEINSFSHLKNYKETKREVQADKGYAIITKTLDVSTIPFQASTIYEQIGKVLYMETYFTTPEAVAKSGPIFTAMDNSFKSNPAYAEDFSPFTSAAFTYTDPDNLFLLKSPSFWTYGDPAKNGLVITYTSLDENAIIMLVKKDLGKTVTRALADTNALELLKVMYKDVRVEKTEALENGSIQMYWAPKSGGLTGLSIYKWSGTKWFFLTWMANTGFEDTYTGAFNQSILSYALPK